MSLKSTHLLLIAAVIMFSACGETAAPEQKKSTHSNKFHNKELLQVYKYKDLRLTNQLVRSLDSKSELIRSEAALAMASVMDQEALPALTSALNDTVWQVRLNAAFAIGQLGDSTAIDAIVNAYIKEPFSHVRLEMLHALGKCNSQRSIDLIDGYAPTTKEDSLGMMWGYYRLGLRRPLSPVSVERAIGVLRTPRTWMRAIACHVLARSKGVDMTAHKDAILDHLKNEPEPVMRMAVCLSLRAVDDVDVQEALAKIALEDIDERVRINAIRALSSDVLIEDSHQDLLECLKDEHQLVRLQAAKAIQDRIDGKMAGAVLSMTENEPNPYVKAQMYRACLSGSVPAETKERVRILIKEAFENGDDRYAQGSMLEALGGDPASQGYISEATFNATDPVISTDGMGALISIHRTKGKGANSEMSTFYITALNSKDITLVGLAASAIREMDMQDNGIDSTMLAKIRDQLELPREVEAWIELQRTIYHMAGIEAEVVAPRSPSPVDWEYIKKVPKEQKVKLITAKGEIVFDVFVEEAPASVGRFLKSIEEGFYNGKTFHRVVPNFVAQGGCPRGDGWGSPDWSLRSEFTTRHYTTGAVGLASAGNDTESCQFFITHSPTPHLDGRYTLFGKVSDGLDVLQQLSLGDVIQNMELVP